jgi:hypothetical protein
MKYLSGGSCSGKKGEKEGKGAAGEKRRGGNKT